MKASTLPSTYAFVTFRDPDPAGDESEPPVYESIWVEVPKDLRPLPPCGIKGHLAEKFEMFARENEEWDNLTSLVDQFMRTTGMKWGWASDSGISIDIPF